MGGTEAIAASTEILIAASAVRRHSRFDDAERLGPVARVSLLGAAGR
jgi:hypothetical protein